MAGLTDAVAEVPGFAVPVHRVLTEPILLGGAPRAVAIMNGRLAGAVGLGIRLWLVGLLIWLGTWRRCGQPSATRSSSTWRAAICASPATCRSEGRS